jgi:hypothetical protein
MSEDLPIFENGGDVTSDAQACTYEKPPADKAYILYLHGQVVSSPTQFIPAYCTNTVFRGALSMAIDTVSLMTDDQSADKRVVHCLPPSMDSGQPRYFSRHEILPRQHG